ncbi:hypothetical protein KY385_02965 [Candidatus Parcubacteria bacterium]|nr:hypothetical protein [Candidatus Parcubacteria bacterium]
MEIIEELPERLKDIGLHVEVYEAENLPEIYIDQLIEKSRQPHVLEYEGHEDAGGRFKDREAFNRWTKDKKRIFYLLLEKENIAGVIWFGERQNQHIDRSYGLTFAIRLYEGFVGKGLSKPFMRVAHDGMKKYYPGQKIWLDFAAENVAAQKAYESFGYKYLGTSDGRMVMGLDNF